MSGVVLLVVVLALPVWFFVDVFIFFMFFCVVLFIGF